MNSAPPALPAAPAAAPSGYPGVVLLWLWLDLGLCCAMGVLGVATTINLLGGGLDEHLSRIAVQEIIVQYGVAFFGITGNVLLIRQRRSGLWFACVALLFVAGGVAMALYRLPTELLVRDDADMTHLGAFALILMLRCLFNLIYAGVLLRARRTLRELAA